MKPWQEFEIVRPLFGEVQWSSEWGRYVRRYRTATIVMSRKNGKSALVSGIILYLLVGDDEESAEIYGAAKDTKQAGKVFEPALRMVQLSPVLAHRLRHIKSSRRLIDEQTASQFEVISADADAQLGHNPHGFYLDEVLSQPDGSLWTAMRTAVGARAQPLLICMTTETNEPVSFGADMIDEAERIVEDPARAPHAFAFVRKMPRAQDELDRLARLHADHPDLPVSLDVWDEANWKWANPALDDFLSRNALREEALEARNDRKKENSFRQFRANQRVQTATRYISLDLWDSNIGELALNPAWMLPRLEGRKCWAGLDLSSKLDMTAWCCLFEDGALWWRYWAPESVIPLLNDPTGGAFEQWCDDGWITVTDGDTIDYEQVYDDIETDCNTFAIEQCIYDFWSGEPVRQAVVERTGLDMVESKTTYDRMTEPMKELTRLLKVREFRHFGNPVSRWMADNLEGKTPRDDPDRIRPVKPDRERSGKRIDGMPALLFAIDGRQRAEDTSSVYEQQGLMIL
ncbi:terminase large subunit [Salininema proteolyticum]|uniref:Terminase large subunit n=1 Tax=Salininema proteolyticum TaxID=1607685 RepID=A0ABV8TTY8_9ACTN